ncbi:hypothetical protein [Marinospirillum sp.]|uniref:hypothetical protein n=1 Tax=Marinospirillum sp. TaxID=2183934 RepID=UPI00384DAD80
MSDRNPEAEILDGIGKAKQFKKSKSALRTHKLSVPPPCEVTEQDLPEDYHLVKLVEKRIVDKKQAVLVSLEDL